MPEVLIETEKTAFPGGVTINHNYYFGEPAQDGRFEFPPSPYAGNGRDGDPGVIMGVPPMITMISPNPINVGAYVTMAIYGSNFQPTSVVRNQHGVIGSSYVSSSRINCNVYVSDPQTWQVTVSNDFGTSGARNVVFS